MRAAPGGDDWELRDGSIVERPRTVSDHPLLARIYERHDRLIAEALPSGEVLEVAFGQYVHPAATVGVEAFAENVEAVSVPAVVGDARSLPFCDESVDGIVGRRFLHHVTAADRQQVIREANRVLKPGGRFVVLEGTPGLYRRLTKGLADRLGVLGENHNLYGHCTVGEVRDLLSEHFETVTEQRLGSPFVVASILRRADAARLFPLHERTQWVRWWTLFTATKR